MQRRLLEGNISRLCGEARDAPSRVRSPLADSKEGAKAGERSESTIDDFTEEKESPEENERSLRSDEEDERDDRSDEAGLKGKWMEAGRERGEEGPEESERVRALTALHVQCKVRKSADIHDGTSSRKPLFLMTHDVLFTDSSFYT